MDWREEGDTRLLHRGVAAMAAFCAGAAAAPVLGFTFAFATASAALLAVGLKGFTARPWRRRWLGLTAFLAAAALCGWGRAGWTPGFAAPSVCRDAARRASGFCEAAREHYAAVAGAHFAPAERGLFLGMVLGVRETVPDDVVRAMRDSGTLHLLAVSGMNVGFVAACAHAAAALVRCPGGARHAAVLAAIVTHAGLVGGGVPVMRATIMAALPLAARFGGRRARPRHGLALAAFAILFADPAAWRGVSFQLSFAATAAMMLLAREFVDADPRTWAPGWGHAPGAALARAVRASVCAQLGVLPIQLAMDGRAPLLALLPNLVCIPVSGLLVCAGLVWPLVDAVCSEWGEAWGGGIRALLAAVTWTARRGAALPGARTWFGAPPVWAMVSFYLSLLLCRHPRTRVRHGARLCMAASLACVLLPWPRFPVAAGGGPSPWVRLAVFDVGQGEACLLLSSAGGAVLVDGGPAPPGGRGEWRCAASRAVIGSLDRMRVHALDLAVLTHPHADHAAAIGAAMQRGRVVSWADGGQVFASSAYLALLSTAEASAVRYLQPRAGDVLWDDGVLRLEVLHPPPGFWQEGVERRGEEVNEGSLALLARAEGWTILLAGDLTRGPLESLAAAVPVAPVFLALMPHHGSRGAVSPALIARARPRWAVASAARKNRFDFPHPQALAAYRAVGARSWVTGRDGSIWFEFRTGRATVRDAAGHALDRHEAPPPECARPTNP